jgi:hypothetical protein
MKMTTPMTTTTQSSSSSGRPAFLRRKSLFVMVPPQTEPNGVSCLSLMMPPSFHLLREWPQSLIYPCRPPENLRSGRYFPQGSRRQGRFCDGITHLCHKNPERTQFEPSQSYPMANGCPKARATLLASDFRLTHKCLRRALRGRQGNTAFMRTSK